MADELPQRIATLVDVTDAVGTGERLHLAATIVLPRVVGADVRVLFGFAGGGYSAKYFDLDIDLDIDLEAGMSTGYSQAAHHAADGDVFVCCDHLGVGDSDVPRRSLDLNAVARADAAAAAEILRRLRSGDVAEGVTPLGSVPAVAIGQSYGGFLLTLAQATSRVFDGVAFLGWSAIETVPAWPKATDVQAMINLGTRGDDPNNPRARVYHWPDVPADIVDLDLTRQPGRAGASAAWGAAHHPGGPNVIRNRNPVDIRAVQREAAAIDVPIFVGVGEIDVVGDFRAEPGAYTSSSDITVCRFPRMAHMHNFASSRRQLWQRLSGWSHSIQGSAPAR